MAGEFTSPSISIACGNWKLGGATILNGAPSPCLSVDTSFSVHVMETMLTLFDNRSNVVDVEVRNSGPIHGMWNCKKNCKISRDFSSMGIRGLT